MSDNTELYYAEMEAARNDSEDEYFKARPQLYRTIEQQVLFRAGFERAYQRLWKPSHSYSREARRELPQEGEQPATGTPAVESTTRAGLLPSQSGSVARGEQT